MTALHPADERFEDAPCPLCGERTAHEVVRGTDRLRPGDLAAYVVARCDACGLAYTRPRPTLRGHGRLLPFELHRGRPARAARPRRGRLSGQTAARGCALARRAAAASRPPARCRVRPRRSAPGAAARRLADKWTRAVAGGSRRGSRSRARRDRGPVRGSRPPGHRQPGRRRALRRARAPARPARLAAPRTRVARWRRRVSSPCCILPLLDSPQARLFGNRWLALDLPRHLTHFESTTFPRFARRAGLRIASTRDYSRRHNASQLVGSLFPSLQKHRLYEAEAQRRGARRPPELAPLAKRVVYAGALTAARP